MTEIFYRCHECDYESKVRSAFDQCCIDNHIISEITKEGDPVNHPSHYTFGKFEVIDVLEDWFANDPLLWQVGKYIARAGRKGDLVEDLKKAQWYLQRRIEKEQQ